MSQDEILPSFRVGNCHNSHKGDSAEDTLLKEGPKENVRHAPRVIRFLIKLVNIIDVQGDTSGGEPGLG